jgi:S1-C subfamily serine protease
MLLRLTALVLVASLAGTRSAPAQPPSPSTGPPPALARLSDDLQALVARAGVVVAVAPGDSLPWQDALQAGDAIYSVDGESVSSMDALRAAVDKARGKGSAVAQVERDGVLRYVVVPID